MSATKDEQYTGDVVSQGASTTINADDTFNIDNIIGFEALYNSMWLCRKGVMWKDSVCSYILNGIDNTVKLEDDLRAGTYKPRPPKRFTIIHPKRREIISIAFRDRIYQRSLNDNCVYPIMSRSFIYDNMACQKNKGTDKARSRLKCFLQRMWRKHDRNFYVLQIDISGYYPNMNHEYTEKVFRRKLPANVIGMVNNILHDQYPGEVGYNPGSQLIQIAGISALDEIDHYIKERLHIKGYIRYMDDLILLHEDEDYLIRCMELIRQKLGDIEFKFNPKKTKVYPIKRGIPFLGFTFELTNTGRVMMCILSANVKHERRKLKKLVRLAKLGLRSKSKVYECYASWRNHASKGNNNKLLYRMDKYLHDLWSD